MYDNTIYKGKTGSFKYYHKFKTNKKIPKPFYYNYFLGSSAIGLEKGKIRYQNTDLVINAHSAGLGRHLEFNSMLLPHIDLLWFIPRPALGLRLHGAISKTRENKQNLYAAAGFNISGIPFLGYYNFTPFAQITVGNFFNHFTLGAFIFINLTEPTGTAKDFAIQFSAAHRINRNLYFVGDVIFIANSDNYDNPFFNIKAPFGIRFNTNKAYIDCGVLLDYYQWDISSLQIFPSFSVHLPFAEIF
jgi:hypothetical protein